MKNLPGIPNILLIADDNSNELLLCERALRAAGLNTHCYFVQDGAEILQWLGAEGAYTDRFKCPLPDLIITDLKMPRVGGLEVVKWVRAHAQFSKLPVVIYSSSDDPGDIEHAMRLGATRFIVKTAGAENLLDFLKPFLRTLNATKPPAPSGAAVDGSAVSRRVPNPLKKILYIENDQDDIFLVTDALKRSGLPAELRVVSNLGHLLKALTGPDATVPDVIVLGLNRWGFDGLDTLNWIRRTPATCSVPVIVYTGWIQEETETHARRLGVSAYLRKDLSTAPLLEALRTVL